LIEESADLRDLLRGMGATDILNMI